MVGEGGGGGGGSCCQQICLTTLLACGLDQTHWVPIRKKSPCASALVQSVSFTQPKARDYELPAPAWQSIITQTAKCCTQQGLKSVAQAIPGFIN